MLLIYDLTMTVFYRLWVKNEFEPLLKREDAVPAHFRKRAKAAKYILQNCHHVPIKIIQGEHGYLSSAVVLKENTLWWQRVQSSTKQRRRPLTQSLGAQIFWVAVSQIFVWIASLQKPGDKFIGLGLSSGLVLLWMLPVVWGTYEVGNFPISSSINEAFKAGEEKFCLAGDTATKPRKPAQNQTRAAIAQRKLGEPFDQSITDRIALSTMNGVLHPEQPVRPPGPEHLVDQPQPDPTADQPDLEQPPEQPSDEPDSERSEEGYSRHFLWFCVQGDEIETGVTMNYGRLHTSRVTAMYVIDAFKAAIENLKSGLNPDNTTSPMSTPEEILALEDDRRFWGTRAQVAEYCGLNLQPGSLPIFRESSQPGKLPPSVAAFIAALIALLVIWGALGAGILIAYQTPTTGLGCYSGSILIYGMLSTLSFVLFLWTSQLSSVYCRRLEQNPIKPRNTPVLKRLGMFSLRALTVLTRLAAKSIAVISALWEITLTILAYSNIFSNCWCDTVYFSRGITAYTTIFIDTNNISDYSRHIWFGGLFLSLLCCTFIAIFFTVSREKEDDTDQTTDL